MDESLLSTEWISWDEVTDALSNFEYLEVAADCVRCPNCGQVWSEDNIRPEEMYEQLAQEDGDWEWFCPRCHDFFVLEF